ncbi:MAG: recombination mediator RecR [Syntrophobacteraceae bacterium]|jgi:recombination protein RecR|nr:recombination mediator RecR [Syntrophobacteraceae bacterium]MCU0588911.1 recombination mediator RecR [Syntrophobacteraceae bacterium]
MGVYPSILFDLIRMLSRLPGLGEKSATRIVMQLLRMPREEVRALAALIHRVRSEIRACSRCYHFTDAEVCDLCRDPSRDTGVLCVVESTADLLAIEQSGAFKGRYHVLQGVLAPLNAMGPENIRIRELMKRLDEEVVQEVIIATNPSGEGEATAHYLSRLLKDRPLRISRIAYGVPMGSDLKYIDRVTIERALKGRQPFG